MMRVLTKSFIVLLNRKTIKTHGGQYIAPYNFLNASALDYLTKAVDSTMFDTELYPTVSDKAGLYFFSIVSNHVFQDGNKRTGLEAALLFLRLNDYRLREELSHDEIYNFTMQLARVELSLNDVQEWFRINIVRVDNA